MLHRCSQDEQHLARRTRKHKEAGARSRHPRIFLDLEARRSWTARSHLASLPPTNASVTCRTRLHATREEGGPLCTCVARLCEEVQGRGTPAVFTQGGGKGNV